MKVCISMMFCLCFLGCMLAQNTSKTLPVPGKKISEDTVISIQQDVPNKAPAADVTPMALPAVKADSSEIIDITKQPDANSLLMHSPVKEQTSNTEQQSENPLVPKSEPEPENNGDIKQAKVPQP